jgi:hypothetical protein
MLKTTIGKSHEELVKLPRNRTKSDVDLTNYSSYKKFKENTGNSQITLKQRNAVIKQINKMIMDTVTQGHYNIRIPNLGFITLIKHRSNINSYDGKIKRGDFVPKVHVYFQLYGEEKRIAILDFDFISPRKYKKQLLKNFHNLEPTLKESF